MRRAGCILVGPRLLSQTHLPFPNSQRNTACAPVGTRPVPEERGTRNGNRNSFCQILAAGTVGIFCSSCKPREHTRSFPLPQLLRANRNTTNPFIQTVNTEANVRDQRTLLAAALVSARRSHSTRSSTSASRAPRCRPFATGNRHVCLLRDVTFIK